MSNFVEVGAGGGDLWLIVVVVVVVVFVVVVVAVHYGRFFKLFVLTVVQTSVSCIVM